MLRRELFVLICRIESSQVLGIGNKQSTNSLRFFRVVAYNNGFYKSFNINNLN